MKNDDLENARIEYVAVNDCYMHYDNFAWQVGAVLLAGTFIYWGFIVSARPEVLSLLLGNMLICLLMSIWFLYAEHNRQIYLFKLHRLHELENLLNMQHHRRFKDWENTPRIYQLSAPAGHILNELVYIIVSLGGLLLGISQMKWADWNCIHELLLFATTIIVLSIILRVHYVDAKVKAFIKNLEEKNKEALAK